MNIQQRLRYFYNHCDYSREITYRELFFPLYRIIPIEFSPHAIKIPYQIENSISTLKIKPIRPPISSLLPPPGNSRTFSSRYRVIMALYIFASLPRNSRLALARRRNRLGARPAREKCEKSVSARARLYVYIRALDFHSNKRIAAPIGSRERSIGVQSNHLNRNSS